MAKKIIGLTTLSLLAAIYVGTSWFIGQKIQQTSTEQLPALSVQVPDTTYGFVRSITLLDHTAGIFTSEAHYAIDVIGQPATIIRAKYTHGPLPFLGASRFKPVLFSVDLALPWDKQSPALQNVLTSVFAEPKQPLNAHLNINWMQEITSDIVIAGIQTTHPELNLKTSAANVHIVSKPSADQHHIEWKIATLDANQTTLKNFTGNYTARPQDQSATHQFSVNADQISDRNIGYELNDISLNQTTTLHEQQKIDAQTTLTSNSIRLYDKNLFDQQRLNIAFKDVLYLPFTHLLEMLFETSMIGHHLSQEEQLQHKKALVQQLARTFMNSQISIELNQIIDGEAGALQANLQLGDLVNVTNNLVQNYMNQNRLDIFLTLFPRGTMALEFNSSYLINLHNIQARLNGTTLSNEARQKTQKILNNILSAGKIAGIFQLNQQNFNSHISFSQEGININGKLLQTAFLTQIFNQFLK